MNKQIITIKKIKEAFIEDADLVNKYFKIMNEKNLSLEKLAEEMATGNKEVYKLNYFGNINITQTEEGILYLFPGSGIIKHQPPASKGISETYIKIGTSPFHYQNETYEEIKCNLDEFHGIDIENTPRIIKYVKTNHTLKKALIKDKNN